MERRARPVAADGRPRVDHAHLIGRPCLGRDVASVLAFRPALHLRSPAARRRRHGEVANPDGLPRWTDLDQRAVAKIPAPVRQRFDGQP